MGFVSLLSLLLFLHILGAIIAFGPGFAFAFLGAAAGREPQHANFVLRTTDFIARRMIVPLAILQGVTGLGLVLLEGTELLSKIWLLLAIVLYGIALYVAIGLNLPNLRRLIELSTPPAGGPSAGGPPAAGPPPELVARVARSRQYGMATSGLVVVIVFLMVVKPF
jgi:uncharacterized membrane protein